MKLGWNTVLSVAFVVQQRNLEWVFCSSFYLSCTLASISFIWSQGTMDKTNKFEEPNVQHWETNSSPNP